VCDHLFGGVLIAGAARAGQPFHDPIADAALFEAIEQTLRLTRDRRFDCIACHINDPEFPMRWCKISLQIAD
jgi:uncharacterized protein (UPF0261 family)